MLTLTDLADSLRALGVRAGDTVLVHSSYKALGPVQGGPRTVIDALLQVVGGGGTVLLPTFNFNAWSQGHYFDLLETPSEMGIIGEMARTLPGFRRTPHPIYSFAVAGARQDEFLACDDPEAFGDRSVFARMVEHDAFMLSIGLDFNSTFSLFHYVERKAGATHRRVKAFGGIYLGESRAPEVRMFSMYVRAQLWMQTEVTRAVDALVRARVIREDRLGEAVIHHARSRHYFDELTPIVREHPEWLYRDTRAGG
jgi:aminoglycoside N3'-acetyltransferase